MSSIRIVQTERLLEDVIRTLYSEGQAPLYSEIAEKLAKYFSKYPPGKPLPLPLADGLASGVSDVEEYNRLLAHLAINIDVLYETSLRQVEEVVDLTNSLQTHLERLRRHRRRIENEIDDYLLGLYNTDGYYFSRSDNFADLTMVDLDLTTAEVDTSTGVVVLPTHASGTSRVSSSLLSSPIVKVVDSKGKTTPHEELGSFANAAEKSLTNLVWAIQARSHSVEEMVAQIDFTVGNQAAPLEISRIDFTPYGTNPVQVFIETSTGNRDAGDNGLVPFSTTIQTSTRKMIFIDEPRLVRKIRITLRKTRSDFTLEEEGQALHHYIFGAKSIDIGHRFYDDSARIISNPISIPDELKNDYLIDAVSLDVKDKVPSNTNIKYYVAASTGEDETFDELNWRQIVPIDSNQPGNRIVRFDGAIKTRVKATENPAVGELQLIPLNDTGNLSELNPSQDIVPGVDIYRICRLEETVIPNSIEVLEGINTIKIFSKDEDTAYDFADIDLDYWANTLASDPDSITTDYASIDSGNDFFYGGDVGAVGKDVFVSTYLDADTSYPTFLDEFQKLDIRAQTWPVKVYLNGTPLGDLPVGKNTAQLPWNLRQGLNHIAILLRIPSDSVETNAFIGSLALMGSFNLYDYGKVRLARWEYTDFFNMQYNEVDSPRTFSIKDSEIISRREPTANFLISYAKSTSKAPDAIRFRADLSRSKQSSSLTPQLDSYGIRFSYGEES